MGSEGPASCPCQALQAPLQVGTEGRTPQTPKLPESHSLGLLGASLHHWLGHSRLQGQPDALVALGTPR